MTEMSLTFYACLSDVSPSIATTTLAGQEKGGRHWRSSRALIVSCDYPIQLMLLENHSNWVIRRL